MNKGTILVGLGGALALGFLATSSKASADAGTPFLDKTFNDGTRLVVYIERTIMGKAGERWRSVVAVTGGAMDAVKALVQSAKERYANISSDGSVALESFKTEDKNGGLLVTSVIKLLRDQEIRVMRSLLYMPGGGAPAESHPLSVEKIGEEIPGSVKAPEWTREWDALAAANPEFFARVKKARESFDEGIMMDTASQLRSNSYLALATVFETWARQAAVPAAPDFRYYSKDVSTKQMAESGGWKAVAQDKIPPGTLRDQLVAVATKLKASPTAAPHLAAGEWLMTRPFAEHDLMRIVMNRGNLEVWARM